MSSYILTLVTRSLNVEKYSSALKETDDINVQRGCASVKVGRVSYSTELHNINILHKYVMKCCFVDMNVRQGEQVLKQV